MADTIGFYRSLLLRDPNLAAVRADMAQALLAAGDFDGAIAEASMAIAVDPSLLQAWSVRATAFKTLCRFDEAAGDLERAAALAPERVAILINLANTYAEIARLDDAERTLRRAIMLAPYSKEAQASLGSVLVKLGRLAEAEAPCRAALALDPGMPAAHRNLAGILAASDPAAARIHRDASYGRRPVLIERAPRPERTLLVLAAAESANVPLQHLVPRTTINVITWYVEYAAGEPDPALAEADLLFNAIGDPDLSPRMAPAVLDFLDRLGGRVLNDPARVARTRRCDLPGLLAGIPGIVVPAVVRVDAGVEAHPDLTGPVLVRPAGSHGGKGLRKRDGAEAFRPDRACYVTKFVDYVSADGWYRKYRVIFIEGRPFPYHLAIARDWMVHYWTAGMQKDATRREEERRFLANPGAAVGAGGMAALTAIGERLGLDYAGIDFGLLPDGRILVFEANATMLVHPERDPCFAYRNPAVEAIRSAFAAMLTGRGAWRAQQPPGLR